MPALDMKYIHYAVLSALFVGLTFTLNLLTIKLVQDKFKFPVLQQNYDMNFFYGLLILPFFIYDIWIHGHYQFQDYLISFVAFYLTNWGCIFSIYAIEHGKAGVV